MTREENPQDNDEGKEPTSLVPLYATYDITRGIQAYRRGDVILYTIRGEPREVLKLVGELDKHGVGEVVALISHHSTEERDSGQQPDSIGGVEADEG